MKQQDQIKSKIRELHSKLRKQKKIYRTSKSDVQKQAFLTEMTSTGSKIHVLKWVLDND